MRNPEILILDDDEAVASMLAEMLDLLGYRPTCCLDPVQALRILDERAFDLILSDVHMPGMEGGEFYRRLLESHPESARRVVFLTGDLLSEDTRFLVKVTGNPHLLKPFHLANVRDVVARALAGCRASSAAVCPSV